MSTAPPFVVINQPVDEAVHWAIQVMEKTTFRVIRTFDLHAARLVQANCPCPHHGTQACDCQMIVLLVYEENHPPVSLVVHGYQETTWFYLINTPQQPVDRCLETKIQRVLTLPVDHGLTGRY